MLCVGFLDELTTEKKFGCKTGGLGHNKTKKARYNLCFFMLLGGTRMNIATSKYNELVRLSSGLDRFILERRTLSGHRYLI